VRLVEDGEQRAEVRDLVDHSAVTYPARYHDLLVQARVLAREDADAATFELARAVRHFEDTVEVVSEGFAFDVTELLRFGQLAYRLEHRVKARLYATELAGVGGDGQIDREDGRVLGREM